ncbi:MAG: DUF2436 domain-containing protein, partial [Lentimicrobiaceae bacterium]|nr:DUF2436 domain-containing protein [Lentimicrobiaceae bacterium]
NQDDELDLLYQKTAGATGTTFDEIWRGIYSITVTLPGYSTYRNVDINITQDNTPAYTVNLTEMLYPVEEVNWSVSGNDMLITWSEPTQDIGKTYFYDDGTAENAWTPGSSEMHIGTKFPVTESGEITAIELFQMADYNAGPRRVSIEIFNDKYEKVGASEKFMFNEPENKWITIPMPNVPYSGTFYAMIRWHFSGTSYYSNLIGVDENGPNANANLDYVRLADGTFVIMHVEWGWHPNMTACIPMIRAHVNSLGKSMTYGYDTEFGVNSAYRTPEPKSTISTQDYPLFCAKEKGLIDETTQTPAWVAPKSGKSHIGYNLYRLIAGQTEPSWTTLGTNLDVNSKIDVDNLVSGTDYYWAVKAVYTNNTVSAPRFSPICPFGRIASVSAYVKTNSGDPVNGARFILSHSNGNPAYIYQRTLNTNNVSINNVLKGSYKLTIELEGYNTYVATVAINDDLSDLGTITLIEIIEKPFKLEIKNVSSCKQVLSWNNITNPFITLNVPTDVWGDASGYQMLLDETAVSYFGSNPFVSCSNIVPAVYNGFNYRIPVGATPACEKATANPNNWVFMNSKTIQVPPGTYDFITINPEVGNALWVPYGEDARRDNFVFEADKHYTFTVTPIIDEDGDVSSDLVTLSVTNAKSSGEGSSKSINSRSFLGFRIYMDGVEVAITKNTEYAFENVPAGAHTAGVQAVYSSGESQIVTINFTSTCTNPPQLTFTITAASENTTLGTATGGGEYKMYEPVVVEATAKEGYEFKYWSENGEWTSYNSRYEFLATANRALVAVFGLPSSVIENALSNIVLYPNPFNNEINISNPEIVKNVQITNLTGQIVKTVNFNGKAISTGDLGIGIYFVTIESITGEKVTMKMVKI